MPDWVVDQVHCLEQKLQQILIPVGAPIVSLGKRSSDIPPIGPIVDEDDENLETNSLALVDEVYDPNRIDIFGLRESDAIQVDDLGLELDAVMDAHDMPFTEDEEQLNEDIIDDATTLP